MNESKKISRDGFTSLLGGIDTSRSPSLLTTDQAAFAGNVDFRRGFPKTRSRFFQHSLNFPNSEVAEWVESHAVQGATIFAPRYREAVQVVSVGGRIFEINMTTFAVIEITPHFLTATSANFTTPAVGSNVTVQVSNAAIIQIGLPVEIDGHRYMVVSISGNTLTVTNLDAPVGGVASGMTVMALDANSPSLGRAWMQKAEIFLIIQDGQRLPIIYDGSRSYRSDPVKLQVPVGKQMGYGKGRLWVAVNESEFVAGDIVGGQLHDPTYPKQVDSVLYFTENRFLANGGAFSTPLDAGPITAIIFMAVQDTSTGNGNMLVFTESAVFSCDVPIDRDSWATTTTPIRTTVIVGSGAVSQYAVAQTTNSDIFFRAADGIRSFYIARREFTNSWGSTPVSTEMDRILPFDDPELIQYGSAIQFDNRLLFTVQPMPTQENAYHRGLGVLDFNLISSMRGKTPPVYDGVWTGFQPILLFKGKFKKRERAFAWARSAGGLNELWEFDKVSGFDNTDSRVPSFIETRSMFGREPTASPLSLKRIESVEIWVDEIRGIVDFDLFYKPDQYPCWLPWDEGEFTGQSVCSEYETCAEDDDPLCTVAYVKRPTFKTGLNFGQPLDEDMDVDDKPARIGYEFQLRLGWTGHCRIRKVLVRFTDLDGEMFPAVT